MPPPPLCARPLGGDAGDGDEGDDDGQHVPEVDQHDHRGEQGKPDAGAGQWGPSPCN